MYDEKTNNTDESKDGSMLQSLLEMIDKKNRAEKET